MKKFILKKLSVFFVLSIIVIVFSVKFFIFDYENIEDFGMAGRVALIVFGAALFTLLLDYILSPLPHESFRVVS